MPTWLPVRAFNRSQAIRIGKQKITSVDSSGNLAGHIYIDLEDKTSRKELAYHTSIGGVYVSGTEFDLVAGTIVGHGGRITVTGAADPTAATVATAVVTNTAVLSTSAPVYSVDTTLSILKADITSWASGKVADILVQINNTTGVVTYKAGTANTSGLQTTPTVDTGCSTIGKFTLTYATPVTSSVVTNLKPY
jgi:hypothetical protein